MKIFLDDIREVPDNSWLLIRDFLTCREYILKYKIDEISLDHDLGNENEFTGYDIAKIIEELVFTNSDYIPPKIYVHSANPVGRKNIEMCIVSINNELKRREK